MSEIDVYQHECIGIVTCPSSYEIVYRNNSHRNIPLYRLDEDTPTFHAKKGDLLLGGGSGESAALRISIPEAIHFFTAEGWDQFDSNNEISYAFWTMTEAFIFAEGYSKLGWNPARPIELWLTEHIIAYIIHEYPDDYTIFIGSQPLEEDGSIVRLPTPEEQHIS